MPTRFAADLVCPVCAGKLAARNDALACRACAARYPVLQGVPLLLPGVTLAEGRSPDAGFVEDIARIAAPSDPPAAREPLRRVFSSEIVFPDRRLGAEGHRFLHRLRSSGFVFRDPDGAPPAPPAAESTPGDPAHSPETRVELNVLTAPDAVRAGDGFAVQVRVVNHGPGALRSTGETPFYLSYWAEAPGAAEPEEGRRTALLIDLPPGRALTQPVFIEAPRETGAWSYDITPMIEQVAWQHAASVRVRVQAVPASAPDPLATGWPESGTLRDYGADHAHALALMGGWLRARPAERPEPRVLALAGGWLRARLAGWFAARILELGGNAAPMLAVPGAGLPGARLYNLDVDPYGLAFGTIQRRIGGGPAVFDVAGDGMGLPFADASLDAVVMFATLHHFPDPARLLRHLRSKLAPGGLICVMCEPVSQVSREYLPDDYREELLDGICEQAFQPWEYRQFFEAAGLRVAHATLDVGSLKVALEADPNADASPVDSSAAPDSAGAGQAGTGRGGALSFVRRLLRRRAAA